MSDIPNVTPFWQRLAVALSLSAARGAAALHARAFPLPRVLAVVIPVPSPFDYLIVLFGVWLAFIRYSYKTLDQTAQGLLTPDQHKFYDAKERANLPYKQFAILMVVGFVINLRRLPAGWSMVLCWCSAHWRCRPAS